MPMHSLGTVLAALVPLTLGACHAGPDATSAEPAHSTRTTSSERWQPYDRDADYPGMATLEQEYISLRDGVRLAAYVRLPADGDGNPVVAPLPVILTQTGYNSSAGALSGPNEYFVRRGYAHVNVDVRGTGNSEGVWEAWGPTEQEDYLEVMEWAANAPWSDGNVGTWGPSFMAITQLLTAVHQHPAHKAIFAIVPPGDVYRDITFAGAQINGAFVPAWLYLVTALSLIPSQENLADPAQAVSLIAEHALNSVTGFQAPVFSSGLLGTDTAYDSEFWRVRSPLTHADRIRTPTFVIGGLRDIFQRSEPMTYEAIKGQATAKLLIGPWDHLQGSSGAGLPADGVPSLDQIALQWFDHYLRGLSSGAPSQPQVTQYIYGEERYAVMEDWPHPAAQAQRWHLHGDGSLSRNPAGAGEASRLVLQQPINGICSDSTAQWSAGILGVIPLPCYSDNRLVEALEASYTSEAFSEPMFINGPIQADIWISTTALDAGVVVRVSDVAPDGASRPLTSGLLTASARALDPTRSRYLDGEMIQPWHEYTADTRQPLDLGEIVPLNVEIFSTSAVIQAGHRLRISVGASDFPRGIPPVLDALDQLAGILTIHNNDSAPSSVVLPIVPMSTLQP